MDQSVTDCPQGGHDGHQEKVRRRRSVKRSRRLDHTDRIQIL